ncbi:capsule assembly Wzi family protein [Leeuwenhoekiella sp. A16]|uniref:capsule assembly Wzi family protein n=1 Tax=Leeuwenhoekiella sp. A16 TaxID=3141462 RepID=UPI003A7FCF98
MNNRLIIELLLIFIFTQVGFAQVQEINAKLESQVIATSKDQVPFWMWANKYGSIPLSGFSTGLIGSAYKEYEETGSYEGRDSKLFDWGAGFEGRVNIGKETEAILIEAYVKARLAMFEFKAGRSKDVMGLVDTTLTSGAFAVSGNALGIPKVEISLPEFYTLPFWNGLFAFKGNFAHGWLGTIPVQYGNHKPTETYFHQKSLYGRLGKPSWRLHLIGGFNHNAYWGNTKTYAPHFSLSDWQEFWATATGKVYNNSKTGNHAGSIDLGLTYDFNNVHVLAYRQQIYDIGGLYHLSNIADGLNGLSLTNKRSSDGSSFYWKKILFEFLYTKSQGGELSAKITPSGDENYYNSYIYTEGWSYNHVALGNPLLTTTPAAREGQASYERDYFINNRVVAFHLGFQGNLNKWDLVSKLTYSINYGTYGTSPIGHSLSTRRDPSYGLFEKVGQFSGYLEAQKVFSDKWKFGLVLAVDQGKLYNESIGAILKANYNF